MGLPEVPLGPDVEEHSASDWARIFKLEVRMCFRLLELFSPLAFPVLPNTIGIPGPCFQSVQRLECTCRTNTETQLTVPGAQEGDERFVGV